MNPKSRFPAFPGGVTTLVTSPWRWNSSFSFSVEVFSGMFFTYRALTWEFKTDTHCNSNRSNYCIHRKARKRETKRKTLFLPEIKMKTYLLQLNSNKQLYISLSSSNLKWFYFSKKKIIEQGLLQTSRVSAWKNPLFWNTSITEHC